MLKRFVMLTGVSLALAACQDQQYASGTKHLSPIPPATMALMSSKGMSKSDPILVRAYKKESEMEVWKRGPDGRYALLKTYPICRWSGQLGPKVKEGDRQAPEGFYTVTPAQLNPNSSYYLSFDTGYPNAFDRAHGRSGSHLMVHGTCSSRGCFAMTDEAIAEVYAIARESFAGGQRGFQFQAYPFRMTAENLAKYRVDPHMPFWKNLKEGSDHFEVLKEEPKVAVCAKRYVFGGPELAQGNCSPRVEPAVAQKREQDDQQVAELVAKGTPAVRVVYEDGGQHQSFRESWASGSDSPFGSRPRRLGEVSRPEALTQGPREILMNEPAAKPDKMKPSTALAYAAAEKAAQAAKTADKAGKSSAVARAEPEKPLPIVVASAGEDSPSLSAKFASLFGKSGAAPAEKAVVVEEAAPAAAAPMPPHRKVSATPAAPAKPAAKPTTPPKPKPTSDRAVSIVPKPDAVTPALQRRAEARSGLIPGSQPVLPAATGFANN